MQGRRESEADLIFDVQMALRGAPLRKDADVRIVTQRIVEHLKLAAGGGEGRSRMKRTAASSRRRTRDGRPRD